MRPAGLDGPRAARMVAATNTEAHVANVSDPHTPSLKQSRLFGQLDTRTHLLGTSELAAIRRYCHMLGIVHNPERHGVPNTGIYK